MAVNVLTPNGNFWVVPSLYSVSISVVSISSEIFFLSEHY